MATVESHHVAGAPAADRALLALAAWPVWAWYRAHAADKLLTVKLPLVGTIKTIRVRDLRFLLVALFGPEVGP